MSGFSDEDLVRLKTNLSEFGVDPGIDVCNYFDDAREIAALVDRLEAAEKVVETCIEDYVPGNYVHELYKAWLLSKGGAGK